MNKKSKIKYIFLILLLIIGFLLLFMRYSSVNISKEYISKKSEEMRKSSITDSLNSSGTKLSESIDMVNDLAIGHTLSFDSNQLVNSYTNKNIVFNVNISEVNYETEVDLDTLINSLISEVGEENAQQIIDALNDGYIYSLEGFPVLNSFKVIMKNSSNGNILKQVDLSNQIKNNALSTQLAVEQNCIIETECIIHCKIEFYDSEGNVYIEVGWDNTYTKDNFITISQIDKVVPTITILPNGASNSQKQNVKITVKDKGGSGLSSSNSYQYQLGTSNTTTPTGTWKNYTSGTEFTIGEGLSGDYYLWVKAVNDNAGNSSSQNNYTISNKYVFNADTTPPTVTVTYSTKEPTNANVTVTIEANEEIQGINGWTLSTNKKILTKTYSANTEENIVIKDLKGNQTTQKIEIKNIDKTAPKITVNYSKTEITTSPVLVTLQSNEKIQPADGWIISDSKINLSRTYSQNTDEDGETFVIKDLAGNETEVTVIVRNIITENIHSDKYDISDMKIKNITNNTTVSDFLQNMKITAEIIKVVNRNNQEIQGTQIVGTGMKLILNNSTEYVLIVKGDVNGNGQADIQDLIAINKHRLEKTPLANEYFLAGDIDENNKIDVIDLLQLNKFRLGKITSL